MYIFAYPPTTQQAINIYIYILSDGKEGIYLLLGNGSECQMFNINSNAVNPVGVSVIN